MVDDFEKMDAEAGKRHENVIPYNGNNEVACPGSISTYRKDLVQKYHGGASSLIARLKRSGHDDAQSLLVNLIEEVITETDNLLGNHLVAIENGDLRDASVISYKRAEVLEKAIKAVQAKQEFEREEGIDIDSPSMMVIFRFFMSKTKETFERLEMKSEMIDLFFQSFSDVMEHWKKELRDEFKLLKEKR
jgi:hypothetical protein